MRIAIEEAFDGIHAGHGGPFGSVIVRDGEIIGRGHNRVLVNHDPTCHGEVAAIRDAGEWLGTHDLSGCELYTTGEPCPMCLCACMWANIDKVYYGCSIEENADIGFRDERFDRMLGGRRSDELNRIGEGMDDITNQNTDENSGENYRMYLEQIDHEACRQLFLEYNRIEHTLY